MTATKVASKAAKALSWAMFFTIGGSVYGAILALGLVGLIFYNRWNYRRMKEEREAEDEYFARLFEEEKARERMHSWRDSIYERFGGQRASVQTMSNSTMGDGIHLGRPREPQSVDTALDMRGRPKELDQKILTLEEGEDITDGRNSLRKGTSPTTTHLPYSHPGKSGRRSSSLESIESWEA